MKRLLFTMCFFASTSVLGLELRSDGIGTLNLVYGMPISKELLQFKFPSYGVTHEIRSGDSNDFHYLEVSKSDEVMFYVISYIEEETVGNEFPIHLLAVVSPKIQDEYGLRVGDSFSDVSVKRNEELHFGAGHHHNYLGNSQIFYNFISLEPTGFTKEIGLSYMPPEDATIGDMVEQNPKIEKISWPFPAWE